MIISTDDETVATVKIKKITNKKLNKKNLGKYYAIYNCSVRKYTCLGNYANKPFMALILLVKMMDNQNE